MQLVDKENFQVKRNQIILDHLCQKITKEDFTFFFLYNILFLLIDITLLIQYARYYQYVIPKIGINIIFLIIMGAKNKRLTQLHFFLLQITQKMVSLLLIILIGYDYSLILILILQDYTVHQDYWENLVQRVLIKIGSLVLAIILLNLLDIIIISSVLFFEVYKFWLLLQEYKSKKEIDEVQKSPQFIQSSDTIVCDSKQCALNTRIFNLPLCYVIISRQDMTITFKNLSFYQTFSQICKLEDEFDELILKKMRFTIISETSDGNKNSRTAHLQKQNKIKKQFQIQHQKRKQAIDLFQENKTLEEVIQSLELNNSQNNINQSDKTLEFYSEFSLDQENITQIYTGQIQINQSEGEIVLTFVDITRQNRVQEERIKKKFQSQVLQSFSHELRTPLNSSLNFLQYCENEKSISKEIKNNFICPAINALRLQSYLINDIIDFISLTTDNLELDIANISIQYIVDEINKLFKSILEMKNLTLFVDLTKNQLKSILTDSSRFIQILANLLQNSIKYSSQGEIILKITSESYNCIKVIVKDEGFGIDSDQLQQINEMLQSVKEKKGFAQSKTWHGFGLLIAQMLLQKLGPPEQKSLIIGSRGQQQGTKITFFIQNQQPENNSSISYLKDKFGGSAYSGSRSNNINGTMIQIGEIDLFHQKRKNNTAINLNKKKQSCLSLKQAENSVKSESQIDKDLEIEHGIGEFHNLSPILFSIKQTQQIKQKLRKESSKHNTQISKIVDYQSIKLKDELENESQLQRIYKTFSCQCKRILSVDDEIFNQKSIQYLLKQHGFEVISAFNGEEALNIALEIQKCSTSCCLFLLILMDYQMPIMNGLKTTSAFKKLMHQHLIPDIHIIGLTAFNSKQDIEQCLSSGMSAVLTKPLKMQQFFDILKQI